MFENSLIELDKGKLRRPKWLSMPVAIVLHVIVGAAVGIAQYWQVESVPEPPINVVFLSAAAPPPPPPPPPPPAPPKAVVKEVPKEVPVIPTEPVQPVEVPEKIPDAPAQEDTGVVGGVPGGVPGGVAGGVPGGTPGGVVGGVPGGVPENDEPLRVGGGVTKPEIIEKIQPQYTEVARKARLQGTVIVEAIIDESGRVTNVKVLKGLPMGLDRAAVEAVQRWRFKPAMFQGRPVKVYYSLTVNFQVQ